MWVDRKWLSRRTGSLWQSGIGIGDIIGVQIWSFVLRSLFALRDRFLWPLFQLDIHKALFFSFYVFKLSAFPSWFDFCQNVHNKVLVLFCSWQIFHYNYFGVNPLFEKLERMPETQFKCKVLKKKNTSTASPFIEYFWRCKTECSSKCYNKY